MRFRYRPSIAKSLASSEIRYYVNPMEDKPFLTAGQFEARAKGASLSIAEICRRANVAQSSFHRWKANDGKGINVGSYGKLIDALLAAETEPKSAVE